MTDADYSVHQFDSEGEYDSAQVDATGAVRIYRGGALGSEMTADRVLVGGTSPDEAVEVDIRPSRGSSSYGAGEAMVCWDDEGRLVVWLAPPPAERTDPHYAVGSVTEQDDGTYVFQFMEACDPADDPHGDGARLALELTADDAILP